MELVASGPRVGTICTCGTEISYPEVYNTGVRPNERAAERLRYKAFRAAGLVKNVGGFAMGLAFLGILFFPLALVGAVLGMYVLTMVRGPLGRYSGRNAALVAITVGIGVFATEVSFVWSYVAHRRADRLVALQTSASDDLRTLLRTERLFRAAQDRYGSLKESRFQPRGGAYTIYLGADDYIAAMRDDQTVTDALPPGLHPKITPEAFTAYAVANLDGDPELDVWSVDDTGEIKHLTNDVPWVELPVTTPSGKESNDEPATALVVPETLKPAAGKDGKIAKADMVKADAGKSDATKAAEKAKAEADVAKAAADKAKADADKAKADADKARADADKAKAEAEKAKAEAEKATAEAKAAPVKVDAAAIEAAKAEAAKGADKMKADAAKASADRAKAEADKAKADAEKAKAEAAKAEKAKTEAAKADVTKIEKPKTEAPKADVTPEKSKTDG